VIVCTRDRAAQLARMLESLCRLDLPAGLAWELILIDNGSGDSTEATALAFADRLPLRLFREPRAGLGHARNRGLEAARGAYLCWTDDDVIVSPGWLRAYREAFRRHPEAAIFGGRILPRAEAPQTRWFAARMKRGPIGCVTAHRDFGDRPLPLAPDRLPWGANFAVRALEQRAFPYDPALAWLGEETDVVRRMLAAGALGWWVPDSVVVHMIPPARQNWAYVRHYFSAAGATDAYFAVHGARRTTFRLACEAAAALAIARAARACRLVELALWSWSRHAYFRGIIDYRRRAG